MEWTKFDKDDKSTWPDVGAVLIWDKVWIIARHSGGEFWDYNGRIYFPNCWTNLTRPQLSKYNKDNLPF